MRRSLLKLDDPPASDYRSKHPEMTSPCPEKTVDPRRTCHLPFTIYSDHSVSAQLNLESLSFSYPGNKQRAVEDATLTVGDGELLSLLGRSGSGKSTLLRLIAGLERPSSGSISLGRETMAAANTFIRPERRQIGLVPQGCDLFPHLNVTGNISYGLRRWSRPERSSRVDELLEQVGLAGFGKRLPHELSGGETQRIALARALAPRPRLLLLDEPFSNLDVELRETLRTLTADLLRAQGTTAIFVTHHSDDAFSISDRIAVMQDGRILQCAPAREIWHAPASPEVAALFGTINILPPSGDDRSRPSFARPDQLALDSDTSRCFAEGTIRRVEFLGTAQRVTLDLGNSADPLRIDLPSSTALKKGTKMGVRWRKENASE